MGRLCVLGMLLVGAVWPNLAMAQSAPSNQGEERRGASHDANAARLSSAGRADVVEPLATDRPDFTEATSTVGRGVLQVEMGYTLTRPRGGEPGAASHSLGEPLFRYGVWADWLELRLGLGPVYERDGAGLGGRRGMEDVYVGAKVRVRGQDGWQPELTVMPQTTLPVGTSAFSAGTAQPGLNVLYAWELSSRLSMGGSTQVNKALDPGGRGYAELAQSTTAGIGLTNRLGMFAEWFSFFPGATNVPKQHYVDTGVAMALTPDLQWDVRVGYGLNQNADRFFVGAGLSVRVR